MYRPPKLYECFESGFCPAWSTTEKKCGFIDMSGHWVIPPRFDDVENFSDGRAVVEYEGSYGIIDPAGDWVVKPKYHYIAPASDGLYLFSVREDGERRYSFLDTDGEETIEPNYSDACSFCNGLAWIRCADRRDCYVQHDGIS